MRPGVTAVPTDLLSRSRARRVFAVAGMCVASLTFAPAGALGAQGSGATQASTRKVSVKAIQHALGVRADGVMGPQTRRALKHFQRTHRLQADGVAGPATLAALGLSATKQRSTLASTAGPSTVLAKIAKCESGGNIHAVSPNGRYFGKYQFSRETWKALGGSGSPADADEATQDLLAARLYAQRGTSPWPACSAQL